MATGVPFLLAISIAEAWRAVKGRAAGEREGLQPDVGDDRRGDARADPVVTWSARDVRERVDGDLTRATRYRLAFGWCAAPLGVHRTWQKGYERRGRAEGSSPADGARSSTA